ncbi:TPA: type IV pili twitching motility protein PilT, partial [Candidatus Sumerlaeota bacterium]|nr:type IV pili twitching motility protein PilT [Candidatus Sumerlaeota bacterium]
MPVNIARLVEGMYQIKASDMHLKVGLPPHMRVNSQIQQVKHPVLTDEDMEDLVKEIIPPRLHEDFRKNGAVDFAYTLPDESGRCRTAAFHQRNHISMTFRRISMTIPTAAELNLPEVVETFIQITRGLFLVTGITGSGKSTTLAGLVGAVNRTRRGHIITIEDPIEYLFPSDGLCLINQMEVGVDTPGFGHAMRHILRCDPDIILIGEMRDRETVETAIQAVDTGHMVFSTLHTSDAKQTVNRILNFFQSTEEKMILELLSNNLHALVSQRLVPRCDVKGVIPACEILVNTPIVTKLIFEGRIADLQQVMKNGDKGMQSFDMALAALVKAGKISLDTALAESSDPSSLQRLIKGVSSAG